MLNDSRHIIEISGIASKSFRISYTQTATNGVYIVPVSAQEKSYAYQVILQKTVRDRQRLRMLQQLKPS
jgi:hypothetical protein